MLSNLCPVLFQSYLYGIEITITGSPGQITQSFNRTFMELKLMDLYQACQAELFQSYLYGIEIDQRLLLCQALMFQSYLYGIEIANSQSIFRKVPVSIVPLWN